MTDLGAAGGQRPERAPAATAPVPSPGTVAPAPSPDALRILVVSMAVVDRPRDGGSLRTRAIRDALRLQGLRPELTGPARPGGRRPPASRRVDVQAVVLLARLLPVLLRFPSYSLLKRLSWGVLRDIALYQRGPGPWPSMVDSAQMAIYLPACRQPVAVSLQNVEHELLGNYALSAPTRLRRWVARYEARVMRSFERYLLGRGLPVFVVSEHDRELLARLDPDARIHVAPNGASDACFEAEVGSAPVVVFVGHLGWQPNIDAAHWLVTRVWPLVAPECPGATLRLVGRSPDRSVRQLAGGSVEVHADVESVVPFVAGARVATAPLLTAGGTRIKIIEALACGTPVVATPLGALGLESAFTPDVLRVHREAEDFARAVTTLLQEESSSSTLSCRRQAEAFRWGRVLTPMTEIVRERVDSLHVP